jgi:hypothetical protein
VARRPQNAPHCNRVCPAVELSKHVSGSVALFILLSVVQAFGAREIV